MPRNLCNCPNCQTDDCPAGKELIQTLLALKRAEESESYFRAVLEKIASFRSGGYIEPGTPAYERHTMLHLARQALDNRKIKVIPPSSYENLIRATTALKYSLDGCYNCPYEASGECPGEAPVGDECLKRKEIKKIIEEIEKQNW